MTLIEMLERNIRLCPLKSAIICGEEAFSYSELHKSVIALGQYFCLSGIKKGDKIAIMMDKKTPELVIAFLSIAACGGIAVPVDCNQIGEYIQRLFNITSPGAVIVSQNMYHRLEKYRLNLPKSRIVFCNKKEQQKRYTLLDDILNQTTPISMPSVSLNKKDPVYFNLTSGTTGLPKCAITTHDNIYWNTLSAVETLSLTPDDIHLCMFPPATHPHEIFARALFLGGTMVLTDHIAPKSLTKVIEKDKVTAMMAIAPIYANFIKCHKKNDFNFTTLKIAESGGMHLDPVTAKNFSNRFGIPIVPVWGSTETAGIALAMPLNTLSKTGSCGIPCRYYETDIIDGGGNSLAPGEVGEMIVRGKGVCSSYYHNKTETENNFRNGWYHTNDMFKKDDDGFFYFVGRRNGMMKVAGMKVFPVEIEDMLIQHPLIEEVGVTKSRDPLHGEIPKAVIVLKQGASLSKEAIRAYCSSNMASYKVPKIIEFRASLPRNPVGKILINQL